MAKFNKSINPINKKEIKKIPVSFSLDPRIKFLINKIASNEGTSGSAVIKKLILDKAGLTEQQAFERISSEIALEYIKNHKKG